MAPPIPAPYLADVPGLSPDEFVALNNRCSKSSTKAKAAVLQKIADLVHLIRQARTNYEATAGVVIIPERPPLY